MIRQDRSDRYDRKIDDKRKEQQKRKKRTKRSIRSTIPHYIPHYIPLKHQVGSIPISDQCQWSHEMDGEKISHQCIHFCRQIIAVVPWSGSMSPCLLGDSPICRKRLHGHFYLTFRGWWNGGSRVSRQNCSSAPSAPKRSWRWNWERWWKWSWEHWEIMGSSNLDNGIRWSSNGYKNKVISWNIIKGHFRCSEVWGCWLVFFFFWLLQLCLLGFWVLGLL